MLSSDMALFLETTPCSHGVIGGECGEPVCIHRIAREALNQESLTLAEVHKRLDQEEASNDEKQDALESYRRAHRALTHFEDTGCSAAELKSALDLIEDIEH